jgi:hypothetical protein
LLTRNNNYKKPIKRNRERERERESERERERLIQIKRTRHNQVRNTGISLFKV